MFQIFPSLLRFENVLSVSRVYSVHVPRVTARRIMIEHHIKDIENGACTIYINYCTYPGAYSIMLLRPGM